MTGPSSVTASYEIAILGAGCAGLSLCCHLLQRGVNAPILLLDRRTYYTDDRTWCFWNTRALRVFPPVSRTWHTWAVRDAQGHEAVQSLDAGGYSCVRGTDFYASALAQIARAPNVTFCLGEHIQGYEENDYEVVVRTDMGAFRARWLFDSASALPAPCADDIALRQRFFGQIVQTATPLFNPHQATLMDFGVEPMPGSLHFMYVLPFSPTQALVENTFIGRDIVVSPDTHRRQIEDYIRARWPVSEFEVAREEAGDLPMTTQTLPLRRGRRVFMIGTAGGGIKPSSGYAFARIQKHTQQLAEAYVNCQMDTAFLRFAPPKFRVLDTIFLEALHRCPEQFPLLFYRLFARVPAASLVRFLSETSTWQDDLRVLRALPKGLFLRAAQRSTPQWLPPKSPPARYPTP